MQQFTVYQAQPEYVDRLARELGDATAVRGPLVLAPGPPRHAAWAQNIWLEPQWLAVESIGHAAKALRAVQRNWALCSVACHRRAALVQGKLPRVSAKPLQFGAAVPDAPLGHWTLWDERTVLASARCTSPVPHGEFRFVEDKENPPTRAYLKLWELFTRLNERPGPGQLCLDLGSSPGGWTWVLHGLGAWVFSVDKAPLDPRVAGLPRVDHCTGSAFGLDPRHAGVVDWVFSDVICYPERLLSMVERWLELGEPRRMACTVKFQAETDMDVLERFAALPHAAVTHLSQNKHEATWIWGEGLALRF
jgi:23S rRNA (cytidine2498-2'-O)-methyltransferase